MFEQTKIGRLILESIVSDKSSIKTAASKYSIEDASKISDGLMKVASLPYKEDVYKSTQEIMKIAADCLRSVCDALNTVQAKKDELEKISHVRGLIDQMIDGGIVDDSEIEEKIASLAKKSPHDLEVIQEAIKLAKNSNGVNSFFDMEKASGDEKQMPMEKRGMFDDVIDA